jgi:hypothetical protein
MTLLLLLVVLLLRLLRQRFNDSRKSCQKNPPVRYLYYHFFFLSFSTIGRIDGRQREREREREKFYDVQFPADFGREEKRKRHVAAGLTHGRTVVVKIRKTKKNFSHFCLKKLKKEKMFFFFSFLSRNVQADGISISQCCEEPESIPVNISCKFFYRQAPQTLR